MEQIGQLQARWDKFELMMQSHELMVKEQVGYTTGYPTLPYHTIPYHRIPYHMTIPISYHTIPYTHTILYAHTIPYHM